MRYTMVTYVCVCVCVCVFVCFCVRANLPACVCVCVYIYITGASDAKESTATHVLHAGDRLSGYNSHALVDSWPSSPLNHGTNHSYV